MSLSGSPKHDSTWMALSNYPAFSGLRHSHPPNARYETWRVSPNCEPTRFRVYGRDELMASVAQSDPRIRRQTRRAAHLTRDMFAPNTIAHRMYVSPALKRLVADCVDEERVFEFADPLAGLIATVLAHRGVLPWHYDTNDFVVSLMIDDAASGGEFEFIPNLRQPGDENVHGLAEILDSHDHPAIQRLSIAPGDLQIFRGRYSLHRVTEVGPGRARIVVVFGYAAKPGVIGPLDRTRAVYGRVTEAHLLAEQATAAGTWIDGLIQ